MIRFAVALLRPLVEPLLKVNFAPPHLPEGSSLVRELKPSDEWLTYRFFGVLFGLFGQTVGAGIAAVAAWTQLPRFGGLVAVLVVLVQAAFIAVSLVTTQLDYELRHYLVGDRSLRVSQGALTRSEATLSYANVQNLEVMQGPLERLFGFQSLLISTAGADVTPGQGESGHLVTLVGLTNAEEVKALILGMLQHSKDAGLGEPTTGHSGTLPVERLREVLAAAKALEAAAQGRSAG